MNHLWPSWCFRISGWLFYFTHPGWESHSKATLDADGKYPYAEKRSSVQVAELILNKGVPEVKDGNKPFGFYLPDLKN